MSISERRKLIKAAHEAGWDDRAILETVLRGVFGGNERRKMVVEWGELLGLEPSDALRIAFAAGLIPSVHPRRDDEASEKPPDTNPGKPFEQSDHRPVIRPRAYESCACARRDSSP